MKLFRKDLIYPELSYKIIGCAFNAFKELGFGHKELIYQRAMEKLMKTSGLKVKRELYCPIILQGEIIGKQFFDFLVDEKVVVELKKNNTFSKRNIDQLNEYLRANNFKLGLLINFTPGGITFKRIVNDI
jgi:GxxExxY protein